MEVKNESHIPNVDTAELSQAVFRPGPTVSSIQLDIDFSSIDPFLPVPQPPSPACFHLFITGLYTRSPRIVPRPAQATDYIRVDLRPDLDVWTRMVADPEITMEGRTDR